ncbi:MAG: diguanylate cyclase [Sneathiella sp.]|nr:diguanylate cyclase [Sneathiella sp.]
MDVTEPDNAKPVGSKFTFITGQFLDPVMEMAYTRSIAKRRKRFLQVALLFAGVTFLLHNILDYLVIANDQDYFTLTAMRSMGLLLCLGAASIFRLLDNDTHIDRIVLVILLYLFTVISFIPVFRMEEVQSQFLLAALVVIIAYGFIPIRLYYLLFASLWIALTLMSTAIWYDNIAYGDLVRFFLIMILVSGLGFFYRCTYNRLTRGDFLKNRLLSKEITSRQKIEQELRQSEERLRLQVVELRDSEGRLQKQGVELVSLAEDMSLAHTQADTLHRRLHDAIDNISEGFVLYDSNHCLIICNQRFRNLYGYSDEEAAPGVSYETLARLDEEQKVVATDKSNRDLFFNRYVGGEIIDGEIIVKLADGRWLQVRDRKTSTGNIVSLHADITDIKEAEERIQYLANHDALTGLPSLRLGMDRLSMALSASRRNKTKSALLFIDLNKFKAINDIFGHDAGDHVLKIVAERMSARLREMDTVARIGGDEFIVILPVVKERADAENIAKKLADMVRQPTQWNDTELTVGASVGVAIFPENGDDPEALMKSADKAMYKVKENSKTANQ